jgi:YVTN family beta-propeller protein
MRSRHLLPIFALAALLGAVPARADDSGIAYISSEKDHAITLVDLKTLTVVGSIPTCKRPRHMQRLPNGRRLMVACSDSGRADLLDLDSRRSLGRLPLGEDPEAKKLVRSVPLGKEPEGVKVSADGKRVYVASEVANMVHVVDAATLQVVKNIAVGKRPRRMAFSADGSELWVSNELGSSVSVISLRTLAVEATIPFELKGMRPDDITPVGLSLSPDGRTMYVGLGRANHVAFVDVATRRTTQLVLVGKRAWNLAPSRDGARLFVLNGLSDDMTVIDTASAKPLKTLAVGRVPHTVVIDD